MCALTVAPWAQRFGLHYELLDHNCHAEDFVRFIRVLHRHLGRKMLLIWDRLNAHRTAANQLAQAGCGWVQPCWLPGYAPELDPVEFVWTQAKYADLANWIPQNIDDVRTKLTRVLERYRHDSIRLHSFFKNAKLPI